LFTHDTSRALDPHLHTHSIVFNATFDAVENRWKALQNYELLRARKFAENAYYHELARELLSFCYQIHNRARGDFQIEGVSDELCERFSKRRAEIDKALAKLLEERPEIAGGDVIATRRLLATAERARKQRDLSRDELLDLWESQLSRDERQAISRLRLQSLQSPSDERRMSLADAVQWAEEHLFGRNSVVLECQVWQEALGRVRGEGFSVTALTEFTRRRGYIRNESRPGDVTLRDVLLREWEIVQTAKESVAVCHPWLRILVRWMRSLTTSSATLSKACCLRRTWFPFFVAAQAPVRASCCANSWNRFSRLVGLWSSSRRSDRQPQAEE